MPLQATWHQLLAPRVSNSGCCEVKVTDGRLCRPDPDLVVRRRLKQAGMEFVESVILEHDGSAWSLIDLESDEARPAGQVDLVVYAGPRRSLDELSDGLTAAPDLEGGQSWRRARPPNPPRRGCGRRARRGGVGQA